ncbi:hypothetical protein TCDM_07290 [Trypanosoma cruzi Dm28c]|uniref:Uncharacterized protein n=2 Tax=Trypanosoma cruzi TaxID=5693 RepID=V5BJG4_TRYCR|nr:hypothetical protein TCDM_07290 [Trypanosoma cruzi Dm28c]KAF8306405.1 hypothetical protein TcBrA4_0031680 [Trypanosoma cruzi]PBJ72445.1 hypothetical protein BCY84_15642 [Trypanosoma cruzi cruzi]PWU84993.1 hypothetical protein C4B63_188g41 [Trypanosoma cruzi]
MSCDPFSITLKTAVNTRAPLSDRVSWRRQVNEVVSAKSALHRGIHTTYDAAYNFVPARTDPSDGNRFLSLLRSRVGAAGSGKSAHLESGTAPVVEEHLQCERKQPAASQHSLPSQPEEELRESSNLRFFEPVLTRHMPSEWETEQQASSRNVLPVVSHGFYSTARKIEHEDDDRRSGLVGNTQRTVDIMRKRASNPLLCPAANNYHSFRPVRPPCVTDESGRPASYCLDIVDCTQLAPTTEEQLGFDMGPIARLPNAATLSQALDVQQRVITHMGTSHPLFVGTAKVMETAVPNYTGHAPCHPRNIAAIRGNDTDPLRLWSKSFMTLAEHGGGVDAGNNCKNPLVRKRDGIRAPQSKELPPKSEKGIRSTVEGSMLQATLKDTLPAEHAINQREDKALKSLA